jgi:hypothetical protein
VATIFGVSPPNPLAFAGLSCPMTTRIEAVIDRLRELPEAEQEMLAGEIEALLMEPASLLDAAQWREVEDEIDTDDGVRLSHADVMGRMRARFGR